MSSCASRSVSRGSPTSERRPAAPSFIDGDSRRFRQGRPRAQCLADPRTRRLCGSRVPRHAQPARALRPAHVSHPRRDSRTHRRGVHRRAAGLGGGRGSRRGPQRRGRSGGALERLRGSGRGRRARPGRARFHRPYPRHGSVRAELPRLSQLHGAPGRVAAVVQSGSIGIALLNAGRDIGLSYLVTSGNEAATSAADYIDYLVDDDDVRVIIGFFEQLRHPQRFVAAARRAATLGKPVIVVKSGRSERGREAVMAHTGAVAGSDEVCDAAFRAAGVIRVGSLDELIEMAALCSTISRRPTKRGVAVLSPSGGEIALALDIADAAGLELPPVGDGAPRLKALLPDFAHVTNPLDLTWAGLYDPAVARQCAEILAAQPSVGTLVLLQDAPRALALQQAERYTRLVRAVGEGAAATHTPLVVVSNLAVDFHPAFEAAAREAGAPCLRGTAEGLFAVARLARWATSSPPDTEATATTGPSRAPAFA